MHQHKHAIFPRILKHRMLPFAIFRSSTTLCARQALSHPIRVYLRALSSAPTCELGSCRQKLHGILEEYRKENYTQTLTSRFIKEVVHAADKDGDGVITLEETLQLLKNIGAADKMNKEELSFVLSEVGITGTKQAIPVEQAIEVFMERP